MPLLRCRVFFCSAILLVFYYSRADAQTWNSFDFVRADWHLANIAEANHKWNDAAEYYQKVIDDSRPLPLDIREWYRGTAYFGIARTNMQMGSNSAAVRQNLSRAFLHEFWNFALIEQDSQLVNICGGTWIDSNARYWAGALNEQRTMWHDQAPIVFYPSNYNANSNPKLPLIIALHGGNGNYEGFAENWHSIADDLHAVIAVPAGIDRESQITNSWGSDMNPIFQSIDTLEQWISAHQLADMSHVYLAGFSQGAQASIELTLLHPDRFSGAIAMSGFVDQPISDSVLRIARNKGVGIYAISGQYEFPTFRAELDTIHAKASSAGIPFKVKTVEGMTHEVPLDFHSQILDAWNWIREPVRAERTMGK